MTDATGKRITRRRFVQIGAGAALAGGTALGLGRGARYASAAPSLGPQIDLAATDGWVGFPTPAFPKPWFPDPIAPAPMNMYLFGFRNVTGLSESAILAQKYHAQASAPLLYVREGEEVTITLRNLGFQLRPDLGDSHTIHWHGFRNASPIFDGVPEMSIAVPPGRTFPYHYHPRDPGTYIYHCHFEDVEHVLMGMTGIVFVRPSMGDKFAYNDATTAFDREFALLITEWWSKGHWGDAHIQESDWTEYDPDVCMLNGRVYPDTLLPNGGRHGNLVGFDASGNPDNQTGLTRLDYQPHSSVIRGKETEKVLLRVAHLGYVEHSMQLSGIPMHVVGKDATLLKNGPTNLAYDTSSFDIGPGESIDSIITLPAFNGSGGTSDSFGAYDAYPLYDRDYRYGYLIDGSKEHAGIRTEVRVYANSATLPTQTEPNTP